MGTYSGFELATPPAISILTVGVIDDQDDGSGSSRVYGNLSTNVSGWNATHGRNLPKMVVVGIILGLVILLTICGNLLVCVTIATNKKLQNCTNYFVLSLAITDLLLGSVVLPFSAVNTISETWPLGAIFCNVYTSNDVMLCTVSILTLFAISLDRYFAVTTPLRYQQRMTGRVVWQVMAGIWVFSFLMAFLPIHLGWNTPDGSVMNHRHPTSCLFELNKPYVLLVSLGTYFTPLFVMCGVYLKVLRITQHQVKEINKIQKLAGGASTAMLNNSSCCGEDGNSSDGQNGRHFISRSLPNSSGTEHHHHHHHHHHQQQHQQQQQQQHKNSIDHAAGHGRFIHHEHQHLHVRERRHREHRGASDTKATVTLASVVLAFAICWVPYFVLFTAKPFLRSPINVHLDLFCLWLGYVNSSINPFLYAFYNSAFREGFVNVLCRRCPYNRRRRREKQALAFRTYRNQRRGSSSDTSEMSVFRQT
ncbi:hypothetical protein LSH36_954g00011 [Paralvinella palmiformis]|uniref:G-protein coupled receptors family 1 profile domain-containing protein n=1 Tax=Paralvinella palmiformis TaxID=53620 RepID=A0AAD9MR65_9ANNE|nr:hypothetical protein LSH36_954g00011 [Paralvinella palmiformis]